MFQAGKHTLSIVNPPKAIICNFKGPCQRDDHQHLVMKLLGALQSLQDHLLYR